MIRHLPNLLSALRLLAAPLAAYLILSGHDTAALLIFAAAGASYISFHPEASEHVDRTIQLIHSQGCKPGLVINPATSLSWLDYTLDKLDLVLLMSVNPVVLGT